MTVGIRELSFPEEYCVPKMQGTKVLTNTRLLEK